MDFGPLQLLIFGLAAGLANVLGGLILFPAGLRGRYRGSLKYLLALGAGFMLAVTFFEIIPKTISIWQKTGGSSAESLSVPMVLVLAGYLATQFFEHTVAPHFHLGEDVHAEELVSNKSAVSAVSGLLVHTFFDGISIAAALQIDPKAGLLVFIAVVIHKFPEGFTIGSVILASGKGRKDLVSIFQPSACKVFSSRLVMKSVPETCIKSPISTVSTNKSKSLSEIFSPFFNKI